MKAENFVDLGKTKTTVATPTYVRVHRIWLTHLLPLQQETQKVGNGTRCHFSDYQVSAFRDFALPLSRPMAVVYVSISTSKDTPPGRDFRGLNAIGKALETESRSAAEWVALLCPQYTGFPIYETEDRPDAWIPWRKK